jgi:hypothetical protein
MWSGHTIYFLKISNNEYKTLFERPFGPAGVVSLVANTRSATYLGTPFSEEVARARGEVAVLRGSPQKAINKDLRGVAKRKHTS